MKKFLSFILFALTLLAILFCASQEPKKPVEPIDTETGIPLDKALSDIVSYYTGSLPVNTKIALVNFEAQSQLLSDYIFEELWIHFEDSRSFIMIDRKNLELIQKEMAYKYSGNVSDESMQSLGHQ